MHCKSIAVGNTSNYVIEYKCATLGGDLNGNDLAVGDAIFFSISGGHMDVTLCDNNTFGKLNLTCRANELACAAACNVARLTDGSLYADGTSVGERNFNLSSLSAGTENGNTGKLLLGANNGNSLFTSKLTGLRKLLLGGELIALAEKDFKMLFANVYVTCGNFN